MGGNALNVAVGLAQAGLPTMYCGAVGDDEDGRMIRAALDAQGVSTAWLETRPEPTAVTLVELRETGDRVFAEEHFGASGAYRPGPEVLAQLDGCTWVHAAGLHDPAMLLQLEHAPLSYDFSDAPDADQVATLAPRLDVAFVSAGGRDRAAASAQARELVAAGAGLAVVTRGGDGAMAWNGKLVERVGRAGRRRRHPRRRRCADRRCDRSPGGRARHRCGTGSRSPGGRSGLHTPRSMGGGMTMTTRSQELFDRAQQYLPGGVGSGTRSPRSGYVPLPVFVRSGTGASIVDEDGNTFIDYVMGQGPLILGHRPRPVIDAITETISERGTLFSLAHDLEAEAARTIVERMPAIDKVRFSSTGTEAAMYALRFARAYTGKPLIVRFEGHYHGWSDSIHWSAHPEPDTWGPADAPTVLPGSTGMPAPVADTLVVAAGTTPPPSRPCSSATATRSPRSSPSRSSVTAARSCPPPATWSECAN